MKSRHRFVGQTCAFHPVGANQFGGRAPRVQLHKTVHLRFVYSPGLGGQLDYYDHRPRTRTMIGSSNHDTDKDVIYGCEAVKISDEQTKRLSKPAGVSSFQRKKLQKDAKKSWDLFYKRNGDRFFKKRYWTRREFYELLDTKQPQDDTEVHRRHLLEVGCGCGDFALPFLEAGLDEDNCFQGVVNLPKDLFIYCCDISEEAIAILSTNPTYKKHNPSRIKAFVADITSPALDIISARLDGILMDYVSLIFVLSALDPDYMKQAVSNLSCLLKPGGLVLFRDYAIYDEAMMRFSEKSKIDDQFYVRQDGTRAYFFSREQLAALFEQFGFHCDNICYVQRDTINNATKNKYSRRFLQAKFRKKGGGDT